MKDWVPFGNLARPHGLKGELKFYPFVSNPDLYKNVKTVAFESQNPIREIQIESLRGAKAPFIIKLKGWDSIESSSELRGTSLLAPRDQFQILPEGSYYWFEIEGLEVFDIQGAYHGRVEEVMETGSNDVYVVRNGKKELLLPAIDWVVKEVDLEGNRLTFEFIEGLGDAV
jgi:16S rRNA processing protein RimM